MEAYIVAGFRSAVGKAKKGGFKNYRTDDLAVDVIKHLTSQVPELDTTKVDDVIVGCANPEGEQGLQVARLISARALGKEVPCLLYTSPSPRDVSLSRMPSSA